MPATKVVVEKKLYHVVSVEKGGELNRGELSSVQVNVLRGNPLFYILP